MEQRVEITSLAFGGKGVGRIGGKVVFVPFCAPGDVVLVEVVSEKKGFFEAVATGIVEPSAVRVEPVCPVYGECGGCHLQHMSYASQLEWKQRILEQTLRRIGKVEPEGLYGPPMASCLEWRYRARARFHVEGAKAGFFGGRSHRVVDIKGCPLLEPEVNEAFAQLKEALLKGRSSPLVRSFEVGLSEPEMKAVAVIHCGAQKGFDWEGALAGVGGIKGFEVWESRDGKGVGRRVASWGDTMLCYSVGGVDLRVGASVFSQASRLQNRALVEKVVELAAPGISGTVVDLFSGAGNLALPLARKALRVIGVESSSEAAEQARDNAARNAIGNASFCASQAAEWLKQKMKGLEKERDCVLVLDPPRGGEPDIARSLSGIRPGRIVYVSCSPPTLARDLNALAGLGYRASRAVLIDMFPQTYHIESVTALESAG